MSAATNNPTTPTRRSAMRLSTAALFAGIATTASASTKPSPDAELICICHQFADVELVRWYRYVTAPIDLADEQDEDEDWDTYRRILATPATTPEGWHAKALAYVAFDREAYDDHEDERDPCTTLLASLLRDMVASERNAIISRCAAEYGPLPSDYTAEGIWVGPSPEEWAEMERKATEQTAARIAAVVAENKGMQPPVTDVPGQDLIGVDEAGNMSLWAKGTIKPVSALENHVSDPNYIAGDHYVIWWKRHAITVHLSGGCHWVNVLFMCGNIETMRMPRDEVEALLIGKVSQDGEMGKDKMAEIIKEAAKAMREARLAEEPSRRRGHISGGARA